VKYRFISLQRTHYPITRLCSVLSVSRSSYYDWLSRSESQQAKRYREVLRKIIQVHLDNKEIYGSPRIHAVLVEQGEAVCVNTVAKIMKQHSIQSKVFRKFVVTTDSRHNLPAAPNLLNREFNADKPNQKWVSDVSFIVTREGWLFLATIMDLFSRKIIGWSMRERHNAELIIAALEMAVAQRGVVENVVLHSDRGNWGQCRLTY